MTKERRFFSDEDQVVSKVLIVIGFCSNQSTDIGYTNMSMKKDKNESSDLLHKFMNNLMKSVYNFLEQLKNYYQAYLSIVLTENLKESSYYQHTIVESKYNNLKDHLTEFLAAITEDSAEIKHTFSKIRLLKQSYKFYKKLLKQFSGDKNKFNLINNITSEYEQIESQLNELVSVHYSKIFKLNYFKYHLKDGILDYQSYSNQQLFSIPIKRLIKDLKEMIEHIGIDKELKKDYSTLEESLHEIESLSSYSNFMPLQSVEDTLTDAGSHHFTPETKKRKKHLAMIEYGSELEGNTQNVKKRKTTSDFNDALIESNSKNEQLLVQSGKKFSAFGDEVQDIIKKLSNEKLFKKQKNYPSSLRFVLESIMPDGIPSLMNIDDQDIISKEYYEKTLQILEDKLQKIDEVDNYIIIHENDKLCKEYHKLKNELDHLEEKFHKTKEQIDHIKDISKVSGDNSVDIKRNLNKETIELEEIEHEINDKKSQIRRIQKLIRKLDKKDYDLQNYKHILYNGLRKLIKHWLLQIQNELDQAIDIEKQIELQNDIKKAEEKMILIDADINDMYLSYNKRKKKRILTDFDYEHFCENSTFTECLYRYDTSSENNNNNSVVVIEYTNNADEN